MPTFYPFRTPLDRRSFLGVVKGSALAAFFPAFAAAQWKGFSFKVEVELHYAQKLTPDEVDFHRDQLENRAGLSALFTEFSLAGRMQPGDASVGEYCTRWEHRFLNNKAFVDWYQQVYQRGLVNTSYRSETFRWALLANGKRLS